MPDPTPNLNLNRPDRGTTDWNVPMNENFTILDDVVGSEVAVWDRLTLGSSIAVPTGTPTQVFSWTVPEDGVYDLVASVEVDTADVTSNSDHNVTIFVDGNQVWIENGDIVPEENTQFAASFTSVTAHYKAALNQGQVVTVEYDQQSTIELTLPANPWNSALMAHRIGGI